MSESSDGVTELQAAIREALQELHDATPEQIAELKEIFREHFAPEGGQP